jgi:hypothetical protein
VSGRGAHAGYGGDVGLARSLETAPV